MSVLMKDCSKQHTMNSCELLKHYMILIFLNIIALHFYVLLEVKLIGFTFP